MVVIKLIRVLLLALSFLGYIWHLSKKIKPELAIGMVFAATGSVMFMAGILNVLSEAALLVLLGGIICLVLSVKQKENIKRIITPGTVFFIVICIVLALILKGSIFLHDDNFSHWAIASRSLIENNRFPNFTNTLNFYSYPLGSAAFIYYFAHVCGAQSEWFQILTQAVLMAGMLTSLFAFTNDKKTSAFAAAISIILLCGNIALVDLLVDTLLPIAAVAAISFCIYYKKDFSSKLIYTIPYTVFLMSIKNSGTLFVAIVLVYAFINIKKNTKNICMWALCAVSPAAAIYLWQKHVKMAYGYIGFYGNHSMSPEYYKMIFGLKTVQDIKQIFVLAWNKIFSLENTVVFLIILAVIILLIYCKKSNKADSSFVGIIILASVSYVVYQIGVVATYLFSMTIEEALTLAAYDRYHKSILIFVSAIMFIAIIKFMDNIEVKTFKDSAVKIVMVLCSIIFICISLKPNFTYYMPQKLNEDNDRLRVAQVIAENGVEKGENYILLSQQKGNHYLASVIIYALQPESFAEIDIETAKQDDTQEFLNNTDYILVFEYTDEIKEYINANFGLNYPAVVHLS